MRRGWAALIGPPLNWVFMTAKTALLHIGTPKTGTTTIQHCLAQAEADCAFGDVRYPLWGRDHNQWRMLMLYLRPDALPPWMRSMYPARKQAFHRHRHEYKQFLFRELRSASDVILSSESLGLLMPESVGRLRWDLESLGFNRFHIVLYIRDPADYYLSNTQQRLRSTSTVPLIVDPLSFRYEFLRTAQTWEQIFPGSLIIRRYPSTPGADVVDDFADILHTTMAVSLPRLPARMNPTISAEAMHILQDYRQTFYPDSGQLAPDIAALARFLTLSTSEVPQTKPTLSEHIARHIRYNHRDDAELIRERHGVDLGLDHYSRPVCQPTRYTHVDHILQSVDTHRTHQLLLLLARHNLAHTPHPARHQLIRVAANAYRSIPPDRRPARLDHWLRSLANT